jgi:hypothetical protein
MRWIAVLCLLTAMCITPARHAVALVEPFSPAFIIGDEEFVDAAAMSCADIQLFLDGRTGSLKSHFDAGRSAAQIFCDAAATHQINPRILLVMAQKEMALLGDASPDEKQLAWALGCGPGWASTRGFAVNIDCGAKTLRRRFDQAASQLGMQIDGVVPVNRGTLALYRYTTHVKGNEDFFKIWTRYWPQSTAIGGIASAPEATPASIVTTDAAIVVTRAQVETSPPLQANSTCRSGWARGQNYLVTPNAATPPESTNAAIWRPALARAGQYRVSAFIPKRPAVAWACGRLPATQDSSAARYEFSYAGGARFDIILDQAPLNDAWAQLGVFQFDAGSAGFVRLSDLTGEPSNTRWVAVDALKFEWIGP